MRDIRDDLKMEKEELKMKEGFARASAPVSGMGDVLNAIEGLNLSLATTHGWEPGMGMSLNVPEPDSRPIIWNGLTLEAFGTVEQSGQAIHVLVEIKPPAVKA